MKRALLSVSDKTGLLDFAQGLVRNGYEIISTGGTKKALEEAGLPVIGISEITGFPEIMDGRVKTLHPNVHGALLCVRDNPDHVKQIQDLGIDYIDLVCVNLYNFAEAARKQLDLRAAIEEIDIGGPCMLRAAAKNFHSVMVVPAVTYYARIMKELAENGMKAPLELRRELAAATFAATSAYDGMIAGYITGKTN